MRVMPISNQNNYKKAPIFKCSITIKPDVAVPFETLTCYKKDGFGYIYVKFFCLMNKQKICGSRCLNRNTN